MLRSHRNDDEQRQPLLQSVQIPYNTNNERGLENESVIFVGPQIDDIDFILST